MLARLAENPVDIWHYERFDAKSKRVIQQHYFGQIKSLPSVLTESIQSLELGGSPDFSINYMNNKIQLVWHIESISDVRRLIIEFNKVDAKLLKQMNQHFPIQTIFFYWNDTNHSIIITLFTTQTK
jgi:hypothetical protein